MRWRTCDAATCVSPAWAASAPQHPADGTTATPTPEAVSTRTVAACTSRCTASMTHPLNSTTSEPVERNALRLSGNRGRFRRRSAGPAPTRWPTATARAPARTNAGCDRDRSPRRRHHGWYPRRRSAASATRVDSMSRPNGTADGQAVSHPRHPTQVSMAWMNGASGGATRPSTSRMAWMRPRGERSSRPETR